MIVDFFNSEWVYQVVCIASSVVCAGMGFFLLRTQSSLKEMRTIYPEELIPCHYFSVRRFLGIAYFVVACMTLLSMELYIPKFVDTLFPIGGLVMGSLQLILVTSALLSLYNSPVVNRRTVMGNVAVFVVLALAYILFWSEPEVENAIRYMVYLFYLLQLVGYTVIFVVERRRYLTIMVRRMGKEEARDYSMPGSVALFILSLFLAVGAFATIFHFSLGSVTLFIVAYTLYYIALAIYFQNRLNESLVVNEITTEEEFNQAESNK